MSRFAANKGSLHKKREQLKLYRRVLPSLDLKYKQLAAEKEKTKKESHTLMEEIDELHELTSEKIPMMAYEEIDLSDLVTIKSLQIEQTNLLGISVPKLISVDTKIKAYSFLAKPHWVDMVAMQLQRMLKLKIARQVVEEKERILAQAVRKTIQRINLLEKVLIPEAEDDIQKIMIAIADSERAAVVRAKIAKSRSLQRGPRL